MQFLKKNLYSLLRLFISYLGGRSYPFVCVLRLNDSCNMKCSYCNSYKFDDHIDQEDLISFLEQIYDIGCRFLTLTGGEPYLYKHMDILIKWLTNKNIYLVINTNGAAITDKQYRKFLLMADEVLISIDGEEKYNDSNRGAGSFKSAMETLSFLHTQNIKITISSVLTRENTTRNTIDFLGKIAYKYSAKLGLSPVTGRGKINNDSYAHKNYLTVMQLIFLKLYIRHKRNLKQGAPFSTIPDGLFDYYLKPYPLECKTSKYAIYLDAAGDIFPCINVTDDSTKSITSIRSYDRNIVTNIKCNECSCLPLVLGNIMLSNKKNLISHSVGILSRFIR